MPTRTYTMHYRRRTPHESNTSNAATLPLLYRKIQTPRPRFQTTCRHTGRFPQPRLKGLTAAVEVSDSELACDQGSRGSSSSCEHCKSTGSTSDTCEHRRGAMDQRWTEHARAKRKIFETDT